MRVRLLGPVDAIADGVPCPVRGLRRKAILATLALQDGQVIGADWLVDVVWGKTASAAAVNTLQSHLSYLRSALGSKTVILARPPGYVLNPGEADTDVQHAERLLRQGMRAADPAEAVRLLREALALWRGRPLADLTGLAWLEEQAVRLDLLRLQVRRALCAARLTAGEHAELIPGLEQLVTEYPLDEQLHAQLMAALYRSGRQADALAAFHRLRRILDEELGIDPSQQLRDLETAILRQDPALDAPAESSSAVRLAPGSPVVQAETVPRADPVVVVPAQLPPGVTGFAGRQAELARLNTLLPGTADASRDRPDSAVICALSGTAGVGKTALAVRWAHQVAGHFPDGQLYVNLRGFDPGAAKVEPTEAVCGFLDAFGVPAARIPAGLDAQAALYRSLLAGKRVLVLLDNARDAGQVQPLLPGSPGCLAIVTSRNSLTSLIAANGARPLALDLLTTAEARDLLAGRLGDARVASDPAAVSEIVARCARLPLALAIVVARAAARPGFPLAVVTAEMRAASHALDSFCGGDASTDARAVFSWSYRALSQDAARLFRLLGLHPGPDIATAAAASLAAIPPERARMLLAELDRAHLLSEHVPGRHACHDLLHAYEAEQARACDSDHARRAATRRVLDHYLHTARNAAVLTEPCLSLPALDPPRPGVIVGEPATEKDALGWFTAEQPALLAAVRLAARAGFGSHAWQLASVLTRFLLRRGLWDAQAMACETALAAARSAGDITGEACSLQHLADGYAGSGRDDDAYPLFRQALRLFETIGDDASQAAIHSGLAWLAGRAERFGDALSHSLRAQDLSLAAGHRLGLARALNNIGYSHARLGNCRHGLAYCQRSLAAVQELGASDWEAVVWCSLGHIYCQLGNHPQSIACYRRSVALSRERGERYNEAATLDRLGDVHLGAGDTGAAERAWAQALRLFDEMGHPDGEPVRAKFTRGGRPPGGSSGRPPGHGTGGQLHDRVPA